MDYMDDQQNNYQLIWMINKQIIKPEIISFKTIPQNSAVCNRLGESVPDLNVIEQVRGSRYIPNRLLNEGRNIFICTPGKNKTIAKVFLNGHMDGEYDFPGGGSLSANGKVLIGS
eukprot:248236_1